LLRQCLGGTARDHHGAKRDDERWQLQITGDASIEKSRHCSGSHSDKNRERHAQSSDNEWIAAGQCIHRERAGHRRQRDLRTRAEIDAATGDHHRHPQRADANDHGLGDDRSRIPGREKAVDIVGLKVSNQPGEQAEHEDEANERQDERTPGRYGCGKFRHLVGVKN
jgi:hypothetical protein